MVLPISFHAGGGELFYGGSAWSGFDIDWPGAIQAEGLGAGHGIFFGVVKPEAPNLRRKPVPLGSEFFAEPTTRLARFQ